jgi:hypothetical protein
MKIDQDYLKDILSTFEDADTAAIELSCFQPLMDLDMEKFIFHIKILEDQYFVESRDGNDDLGFIYTLDGSVHWANNHLRLTASGHEFIEALKNEQVWETIKTNFKDSSAETLWSVSKQLLEGYAKKKVETLLGISE